MLICGTVLLCHSVRSGAFPVYPRACVHEQCGMQLCTLVTPCLKLEKQRVFGSVPSEKGCVWHHIHRTPCWPVTL